MAKELEYFKEFLENPSSDKVKEFYEFIHEWIEYINAHAGEFNYLEDEEWREIKDRVLEALEEKEDMREEFEELEEKLDSVRELETDAEKIAVYKEWLAFMKRNQDEYRFTDEQISESERKLNELILKILDSEAAHERLKRSQREYQESVAEVDEALTEHYVRTGKRLVLTSLKRRNGN